MTSVDRATTGAEVRVIASGIATTTVVSLPVFFIGALAVLIRADIELSETRLGLAITAYFAGSAASSIAAGRAAERFGVRPVTAIAGVGAVVTLGGIAALAESFAALAAFMAVAGVANSVGQLGANLSLARGIRRGRQGTAFGIKQSAVPLASVIAGVGVPALGVTVGWRAVFAAAAGLSVLVMALSVRASPARSPARFVRTRRSAGRPRGAGPRRAGRSFPLVLIILALAGLLASVAATSLGAFLVSSATEAGFTTGAAGLLLAGGSLVCITSRLVAGTLVDRRQSTSLTVVAVMLVLGAIGLALLATGSRELLIPAAVLGFGCGWAWPGLMHFSVARLNPAAPAAALGITLFGGFAGSAIGPPLFGLVVERSGYDVAWGAIAVAMVASAVLVVLAGRLALSWPGPYAVT